MSKIAKNTSFLFVSNLIGKAFSFGLLIVLPRYLGEGGFGRYFFAVSFAALAWGLVELGMQAPLIREVAKDTSKAKQLVSNALSMRLILSVAAMAAIAFALKLIGYPKETVIVVYIIGTAELLNSISYLFRSIFRAYERMEYEALSILFERGLAFFAGGALVVLGYDLMAFCLAVLVASFLSLAFTFSVAAWKFTKVSVSFEKLIWVDLLKKSLPFAIGNAFSMLYFRADAIMLSKLSSLGDKAVGWYGIAYSLIMSLTILPGAFSGAIFPAMARSFNPENPKDPRGVELYATSNALRNLGVINSEFQSLYSKSLRVMINFAIPMAIFIWVLSDEVVKLLYPPSRFPEATIEAISSVLRILGWAGALLFLNFVFITLFRAADKRVAFTLIIGLTMAINIATNAFLIPKYDQVGSAIAMVVAESFFFISSFVYIWVRICRPLALLRPAIKLTLVSILSGAVLAYFKGDISPPFLAIIGVVLYVAIVFFSCQLSAVSFQPEEER